MMYNRDRAKEVILYILSSHKNYNYNYNSIKLANLCFLADKRSWDRNGKKITYLQYRLSHFGVSRDLFLNMDVEEVDVIDKKEVDDEVHFDPDVSSSYSYNYLSSEDKQIIDSVIDDHGHKNYEELEDYIMNLDVVKNTDKHALILAS